MDIKELYNKASEAHAEMKAAEVYLSQSRKSFHTALDEYSNAIAFQSYGLRIGDVIEWEKKTLRKTETVRIKITGFGAFFREDNEDYIDMEPRITGTVIKRDGTLGTKQETYYSFEKVPFRKVDEAVANAG